jgi:hypothetical protein
MASTLRLWSVVGALTACLALGCAETVPPEQAAVSPKPVSEATDAAPPADEKSAVESAAPAAEAAAPASTDVTVAEFEEPFPDRIELFVAPKRQGAAAVQGSSDNAVELLGFVRVDRPRAVLEINGEISPMAEGDSHFGIEVISVHPPNVVLQRGRQRWQATLE